VTALRIDVHAVPRPAPPHHTNTCCIIFPSGFVQSHCDCYHCFCTVELDLHTFTLLPTDPCYLALIMCAAKFPRALSHAQKTTRHQSRGLCCWSFSIAIHVACCTGVCVCQSARASEHQSTGLHKWLSLKHMAAVVPFLFIICHPGTEHL